MTFLRSCMFSGGDLAHKPDIACAVDQPPAILRNQRARVTRGLRIGGVGPGVFDMAEAS